MKCPVCHSLKNKIFLNTKNTHGSRQLSEEEFLILKCQNCGLIFPQITPGKDFYQKYYPRNYYHQRRWFFNFLQKAYQKLVFLWLQLLLTRLLKKGRILDFGCGQGEFLASLPESFEKYGIEVNLQAIQFIKKNFPQIKISRDLSSWSKKQKKFQTITLWHVLEHLQEPEKILSKLINLLEKDGYLILSTPNSQSWGLSIGRSHWFHLDSPRHLAIFNLKNLTVLLKKKKLKIIKVQGNWLEYPLDFFWSIFNHGKTQSLILNFFLGLFILPVSFIIKAIVLFIPKRAEVVSLVAQKR